MRFKRFAVSGLDRDGKKIRLEGEGLFAQCLQHEIGHLLGELYLDRARDVRPAETDEEDEAAEGGVPDDCRGRAGASSLKARRCARYSSEPAHLPCRVCTSRRAYGGRRRRYAARPPEPAAASKLRRRR